MNTRSMKTATGRIKPVKIFEGTHGRYVTFERLPSGMWAVVLRSATDQLDKMRCDDYRDAIAYRKAFLKIARS